MKTGVSLSTLRRYIKADKVKHRVENGRYLLWDEKFSNAPTQSSTLSQTSLFPQLNDSLIAVQQLEKCLEGAHQEIAELKTLIAFYEESHSAPRL